MGQITDTGELIQGTLEMLVLKALLRGPLHGYSVAEWIQQTSQQMLKVEEGALYPALHRMELRGLLKSKWGTSDNNRRAKILRTHHRRPEKAQRGGTALGAPLFGRRICHASILKSAIRGHRWLRSPPNFSPP